MGKPLEGEEAHRGQVLMAAKAQQQIAHQMGQLSVTEAIARGEKKGESRNHPTLSALI